MYIVKEIVLLFKKPQVENEYNLPDLALYSLLDYQESNLENYLSGGCLNNIY